MSFLGWWRSALLLIQASWSSGFSASNWVLFKWYWCIDLASMLKLNQDKTELLVIGPKHKVNPPIKGIHVAGEYIEVSNNARNIGVIFYAHVNLEKHVINTCKTAFYHLRNIAKIRNCLSQDNAETLVHAFISSKLDFCNALLYGLPQSVIDRLQYVQNCAARLVTRTRSSEHITPVLRRLHWLPVRQWIKYKILLLTYKALNGMVSKYIALISFSPILHPTRQLRSSSKNVLVTQKYNITFYGNRSFQVAASRLLNSLTDNLRSIQNLNGFKNKIKTLLFSGFY